MKQNKCNSFRKSYKFVLPFYSQSDNTNSEPSMASIGGYTLELTGLTQPHKTFFQSLSVSCIYPIKPYILSRCDGIIMGQNKPLNPRDNLKVTRKSAFAEFANTGIFGKWYWNNVRARPNHAKVYEKLLRKRNITQPACGI